MHISKLYSKMCFLTYHLLRSATRSHPTSRFILSTSQSARSTLCNYHCVSSCNWTIYFHPHSMPHEEGGWLMYDHRYRSLRCIPAAFMQKARCFKIHGLFICKRKCVYVLLLAGYQCNDVDNYYFHWPNGACCQITSWVERALRGIEDWKLWESKWSKIRWHTLLGKLFPWIT